MSSTSNVCSDITANDIKKAFRDNLCRGLGRLEAFATKHDIYVALALTIREKLLQRTVESMQAYGGANARRVAYLSAEFLPGPHLANNLLNLGITDVTREALHELGYDLDEILAQEEEPGLGNGGLGRLASCYMDSLASVRWTCILDTAEPDAARPTFEHMSEFPLEARSLAVLRAELQPFQAKHEQAKIILRAIRHRSPK